LADDWPDPPPTPGAAAPPSCPLSSTCGRRWAAPGSRASAT